MSQQNTNAGPSSNPVANAPASTDSPAVAQNDMIKALGNIVKSQTGEPISNEKISQLLLANMATLVQQGKLTQRQIIQVRCVLRHVFHGLTRLSSARLLQAQRVCGHA